MSNPLQLVENIPEGIRSYNRWLHWRYKTEPGETKPRKRGCYLKGNRVYYAGWNKPGVWTDFENAKQGLILANIEGLGFHFSGMEDEGDLVAIDFDNCIDDAGRLNESVKHWLDDLNTYTERSPSGKGIRVLVCGDAGSWRQHKAIDQGVELFYDSGFVTITGDRVKEYSPRIEMNDDVLQELYRNLWPEDYHASEGTPKYVLKTPGDRLKLVQELMSFIPEECKTDYHEWLKVGMALHHTLPNETGLNIWNEWSEDAHNYIGPQDLSSRWEGFSESRNVARTIRTLEYLATQGGWERKESIVSRLETSEVDTRDAADRFIANNSINGCCRLRWWRGDFYAYRDGKFRCLKNQKELNNLLSKPLSDTYRNVKDPWIGSVSTIIGGLASIDYKAQPPLWLAHKPEFGDWDPRDCFVTETQIVHLPSKTYTPTGPHFFSLLASPIKYDPDDTEAPHWFGFLDELWGDRDDAQESFDLLQAWFGYCLTQDTRRHKMLIIHGPTRSGKTTIGKALEFILGEAGCQGMKLSGLVSEFGLQHLVGASVAVLGDMRPPRVDSGMVETLLSIVGGDLLPVNRKTQAIISMRLPCKLIGLCNEIPDLPDRSGALMARYIFLQTYHSFLGREDRELENKIASEAPAILNWAIEGYHKLQTYGLVEPSSQASLRRDLQDNSNPIRTFALEKLETIEGENIPCSQVWDAYEVWHNAEFGFDPADGPRKFYRELGNAVPRLTSKTVRIGKSIPKCYENLRVK